MRKHLAAALLFLSLAAPAQAANVNIPDLPAASSVAAANLFECYQTSTNRKCTSAQIAAYIYSLMSGDATATSGGAVTFATVNSNVGSFGSASNCVTLTVNAKGLITAASAATCTPAVGSVSGLGTGVATALGVNIGSAGAPILFNGAGGTPSSMTGTNITGLSASNISAGTLNTARLPSPFTSGTASGNTSAFATVTGTLTSGRCVQIDASGNFVQASAACGTTETGANPTATAGPTAVNGSAGTFMRSDGAPAIQQGSSSVKGIVQVDNTTITAASGVISAAPISAVPSVQTGTNYPIVDGDRGKVIYLSNASAQTPTLPSAATLTNSNGWFVTACNIAAGIQTLTPNVASTIGGATSLAIPGGSAARPVCWNAVSDGTNYSLVPAGNNNTIFSGTAALGTSAIGSAACATAVTTSAPGVATTDVVLASFNGDPTAVTGYVPLVAGMLTIIVYPTANNIVVKVCNNTSGSITPGAITLNLRANR